jgi:hypothetical protein
LVCELVLGGVVSSFKVIQCRDASDGGATLILCLSRSVKWSIVEADSILLSMHVHGFRTFTCRELTNPSTICLKCVLLAKSR